LKASHSQILPETHYVDAFLPPTASTARFRRGIAQRFECRPSARDGDCSDWQATGDAKTYIQVADQAKFGVSPIVRSPTERPIVVEVNFSDNDLISLVAFIRSKPPLPPLPPGKGRFPDGVSGRYPVASIWRDEHGAVLVGLTDDGGIGETATVTRTAKGWKLVQVGSWVS